LPPFVVERAREMAGQSSFLQFSFLTLFSLEMQIFSIFQIIFFFSYSAASTR